MRELKTVILAAGKGTRLRTEGIDLPKVMRLALGKPLIKYVLDALPLKNESDAIIVVGYKKEYVMEAFPQCTFAHQTEQLGTGHAVMSAAELLRDFDGDVMVCCGDMPLVRAETYSALYEEHKRSGNDCTLLSGTSDEPLPYGRVLRDENGGFIRIVEDKDCTPEEAAVRELNAGIYVFNCQKLLSALSSLSTDNAQKEYYLTDVPDIMLRRGDKVGVCVRDMGDELIGVNTIQQLWVVEERLLERTKEQK
jgi:UDP-N-acetylglucosamine diphosphorylase/glucosamine-1-phosphate N-acetyltransferase